MYIHFSIFLSIPKQHTCQRYKLVEYFSTVLLILCLYQEIIEKIYCIATFLLYFERKYQIASR
jgi:hypothetical protein